MGNGFRAALLAGLVLLSGVVYLAGNGSVALWDRDEPRYAETSRQMLQSGDWVVPHYLNKPRTAKPAMIYWCQAGAMKVFGDNAFAARLPSAVSIVLLLIVLSLVLWKPLGSELTLWMVFIFATSGLTIAAAKMCITDALLLLWVTISQLCFYAIWRGDRSWRTACFFWLAIGVACLTKGPVILGLLSTTALALTLFEGRWTTHLNWRWNELKSTAALSGLSARARRITGWMLAMAVCAELVIGWRIAALKTLRWLNRTRPLAGLVIVLAVVLPWVAMVQIRATGFLLAGFKHEVWDRMMTPLEQHVGPPGYYFLTVWLTFFPWSLLLPFAAKIAWRNRSDPRVRFAIAAIIGPWILLECVRTKLPHYLLPAFPPLAF